MASLQRLTVGRNAVYKANGTKSYVHAMRKCTYYRDSLCHKLMLLQMALIPRNPAHIFKLRSSVHKESLDVSEVACVHITFFRSGILRQRLAAHRARLLHQATGPARAKFQQKISRTIPCTCARSVSVRRHRSFT